MRRTFWALLGVGIGAAIGVATVRAINRTKQRMSPANVARTAGARGGAFADRLRDAMDAGRTAMIEREAGLRAELNL